MAFPPHLIKFLFAKKLVQKTEHPAGLNKWGPLRVSNVLRPDKRVAEPWIGRAQWPRRVLGAVGAVAYSSCGRAPIAGCVFCVVANSCCSGPGPLAWCILRTVEGLLGGACSVDVRAQRPWRILWMSWRPPLFMRVVGAWCILWLSGGLLCGA